MSTIPKPNLSNIQIQTVHNFSDQTKTMHILVYCNLQQILNSGYVQILNDSNFEWDLKYRNPTIWNLDKWLSFCQKPFKIWKKKFGLWMVWFWNGLKHGYSPTLWQTQHLKPIFNLFLDFERSNFRSPLHLI